MNMITILLIAGRQANGPGLAAGSSYIAQLTRRLQADGLEPVVHLFRPFNLDEVSAWLAKQPLMRYDLVIFQPDFGKLLARKLRQQLSVVLGHLHPVRNRTFLLTPLPQRNRYFRRIRQRTICLAVARVWGIPCFDTTDILGSGEEFFQADAREDLSAVAHELLGSELYQAYHGLHDPSGPSLAVVLPAEVPAWRRYFTAAWR
ncbi:hypothetical protein J2I47_03380 [Fibrella sp. HMF5335]|uniref:Uncharacterized protein n=1 Tax=Fibrella rubiginis TaxID=2817060 RepID=A0A939GFN3_9BACT|nr:hypothetical protein [Fibrella rubiginis]MBO0935583.1 hypothetical protein [Fibrella rubiginis]